LGAIIGGVVGGIGAAIVIVIIVLFYMKRRTRVKNTDEDGLTPAQRSALAGASTAHAGAQAHHDGTDGSNAMFLPQGDQPVESDEGARFTFQPMAGNDGTAAATEEEPVRYTFQQQPVEDADDGSNFTFQQRQAAPVAQPVGEEEGLRFSFQPRV
jgi:hypothetical protein